VLCIVRGGKDYFGSPNIERFKLAYEMGVASVLQQFIKPLRTSLLGADTISRAYP
jgi:hypothetical protein